MAGTLTQSAIVAFNTAEGWSRDVTMDIADELRRRYAEFGEVPESILAFMDANRRKCGMRRQQRRKTDGSLPSTGSSSAGTRNGGTASPGWSGASSSGPRVISSGRLAILRTLVAEAGAS